MQRIQPTRLASNAYIIVASIIAASITTAATGQVIDFVPPRPQDLLAREDVPTPARLIERHLEATGGRAAYERLRTRRTTGVLRQEENGNALRLVIHHRAPNDRYVELGGPGPGLRKFVTNADESWTYDGDVVVASGGEQRRQEIHRAAYDIMLEWERHYPLSTTMGTELVGNRPAWKVRLLTEECHKIFLYFDKESGLNVRRSEEVAYADSVLDSESTYTEYAEFDGVQLPTRVRRVLQYAGGRSVQLYEFNQIEHNVEMGDELFQTPFELRSQ